MKRKVEMNSRAQKHKNTRSCLLAAGSCLLVALLLSGCGRPSSEDVQKARLVGNENLRLKKELADRDARIQDLQKQVAGLESQKAEISESAAKTEAFLTDRVSGLDSANKDLNEAQDPMRAQQQAEPPAELIDPAAVSAQAQETIQSLLEMVAASEKLNEELTAQNQSLKDELQKLKQ